MEYDPHLEARVASLETAMQFVVDAIREIKSEIKELRGEVKDLSAQMRSDFRILFGAIITLGIGQAGLLARAFGWI